ncbi:MAG: endonuclease/exonuclease/phosphatase family protein, partial [Anaerolineae bacterium]|nr:endonuclease/exonuclease/phosphatase family protein [Anaerolineae bacterium]
MGRKYFKVATFNLLNLASAGKPYYNHSYDDNTYKRKVEWLAAHLRFMNPDIVGFQEVFHPEALEDVITATGAYQNANILVGDRPEDGGPAVALVSRFPVSDMDVISDIPEQALLEIDGMHVPIKKFSRPVLRAKLRLSDELSVTVYVAHLKSKRPKLPDGINQHDPRERGKGEARSLIIRAAEASGLRHLLLDT